MGGSQAVGRCNIVVLHFCNMLLFMCLLRASLVLWHVALLGAQHPAQGNNAQLQQHVKRQPKTV